MADDKESSFQADSLSSEEKEKLPTVRDHVPMQVWLVSTVIFLERAGYYGAIAPFQNYLQNPAHDSFLPGMLGLGQSKAIMIWYIWLMFNYMTPLGGGLIADCWLGRLRTIQLGFLLYLIGVPILVATAFTQEKYEVGGLAGFIVAGALMDLAVGAVKPNLSAFMIDQYLEKEPRIVHMKNGKIAITSREVTIRYIYNVNYWMTNVGGLAGILTTITEKDASFGFAFLIALCLIAVSAVTFQAGVARYTTTPPTGNMLPVAFKAFFGHKERSEGQHSVPEDSSDNENDIVADVKAALRSCLVFLPFPPLMLGIDIMTSGLVAQAGQMQTHGIPNDVIFNLNPVAVMVLMPFIQGWIYPSLAKRRIDLTPKHRIGIGLFFAAIAMAYSAGIQALIYGSGPCFEHPLKCESSNGPNNVNIGLQVPTYVFLALAEIFTIVAGMELAYTRAPASMKSIVQAIFLFFSALGAAMGIGISFAANDPNMVIVYGAIGGFLVSVLIAFILTMALKPQREERKEKC